MKKSSAAMAIYAASVAQHDWMIGSMIGSLGASGRSSHPPSARMHPTKKVKTKTETKKKRKAAKASRKKNRK